MANAVELLEWIADGHWPVAYDIRKELEQNVPDMQPELVHVLRSNDGMWKIQCLGMLRNAPATTFGEELWQELRRLAEYPSRDDQDEDVDVAARALLRRLEA